MNPERRNALRAAVAIYDRIACLSNDVHEVVLPEVIWDECRQLARRIVRSVNRGWYRSAAVLRNQFSRAIESLSYRINDTQREIERRPATRCMTATAIYEDIAALDHEFVTVSINFAVTRISVETDDIALDGVHLGPFQIELDWSRIDLPRPYEVVAIHANPAATSSETTHPHVQSRELCEGDGHVAIRQALRQGRVLDFFTLVRQILETYNPSSAFVSLEDWHGIQCHDCGRGMDEDERGCCPQCGKDVCCDCCSGCASCDDYFCSDCVRLCNSCDECFCLSCLTECSECGKSFCEECLTDAICQSCQEVEIEDTCDTTYAAVHPVRLVEVSVPA